MLDVRDAAVINLATINALIEAAKRSWPYDESYLHAAMPLLRVDRQYLQSNPCFEAHDEAGLVGFAAIEFAFDSVALLDHLWVAPRAQGRGIGRQLFQQCVIRAQSDARVLRIYSDPPAEGFYLRLGCRRVGTKPSRVAGGPVFPVMELQI